MLTFLPKAFLFDLDGTLVEFEREFMFDEADRILPLLGHPPIDRERMEDAFSSFDFFSCISIGAELKDEFIRKFFENYQWHLQPKSTLLPGIPELLKEIKGMGMKIAIATARLVDPEVLRGELEGVGIALFIDDIFSRVDESHDWKDKRPTILRACRALACNPAETVMVGDIPHDIVSAQEVGCGATIAVLSGGIRREILERSGPTVILRSVSELREILQELGVLGALSSATPIRGLDR